MRWIGVHELRRHMTSVLREVQEHKAEYVVTYRGRPVALLRPIEDDGRTAVAAYLRLIDELRQAWPRDVSIQQVVDDIRSE